MVAQGVCLGFAAAEIARSFWTNEEMGGKLRLDGVVCVVDSKNIIQVSSYLTRSQ